ncbi:MAG TPA: hypothetical protein DCZ95_18815 [Verrucomicrobia bacterium]|nr:MAG: hypothetical protein A2X46_17055 [Lentisphaerae bacterium GWF2_57_35]HBA86139.1 hypothetical protein [Verrucomicrobiota bacterium]
MNYPGFRHPSASWAVSMLFLVVHSTAFAQTYRNLSTVQDGSGVMSTNAVILSDGRAYTNVSASGQPGGVAISSNPSAGLTNYAGFLQAVDIKRPDLRDRYGNPYELTPDNDADGLSDLTEVTGTNFNPVTATDVNQADTDNDGVSDWAESVAGTNPTNSDAFLEILAFNRSGTDKVLQWSARDGKSYRIRYSETVGFQSPTNILGTSVVNDLTAPAPWYPTVGSYTNAGLYSNRYYVIEVIQP